MDIRSQIMAKQAAGRSALMGNFTNADEVISKGITQEQFDDKYQTGHEVFTAEAVEQFQADCIEKGEDSGAILEEIATLERVEVIKGEETVVFFVKAQNTELWDSIGEGSEELI